MGLYAIPVALLLGGLIILVELKRKKQRGPVDFLTLVNAIYFMSFAVSPIFLMTYDVETMSKWTWLTKEPRDSAVYFYAALIALFAYVGVLLGYGWAQKLPIKNRDHIPFGRPALSFAISDKQLLICGLIIGAIGTASFGIYTMTIGGPSKLFELAIVLRGGGNIFESKWMFLKNVSPFMLVASYFFYALMKQSSRPDIKRLAAVLFAVMFALSMALLFHKAGRMGLLSYLITFPIANMLFTGKIKLRTVVFGGLFFVFITLFGKQVFNYFMYPDGLTQRMGTVSEDTGGVFAMILAEFGFPFATLVNVMTSYPAAEPFRWFQDVAVGWMYILPDRLVGDIIELPATVSQVNTEQFGASGTVPVDLLSFGYLSMGLAGVAIAALVFGIMLAFMDRLFKDTSRMACIIFRVAWMNFFAFRVMYSDPEMFFAASFSLAAGTVMLLGSAWLTNKKQVKEYDWTHERQGESAELDHRAADRRRRNDAVPNGDSLKPRTV
ncbi:hypothetical protein DNH61_13380 [Paenibacillus sambharensis]|uniref:Oligosaccharide repeat unit polymerase n=1 Tax=Paenibacillus sambharensis TaxID=1803190 RepID=A0A2W1L5U9_9BACL|nr:O-antigen polymerase [Paenibacillus sambharensis]PZD95518.1 hypothetical protein DNH61_13380 [Paenibacillus sambharensis]